jgi:hypothetical protein
MKTLFAGVPVRRLIQLLLVFAPILISGCSSSYSNSSQQVSVTVTPANVTVKTGQTQQFSAYVTGTSNTAVTWQVSSSTAGAASIGSISTSGLYTPPAAPPPGTVTVTATSQADTTKSGMVIVTVADGTAPSAPTGLTANATSATQISLAWTASTDNVGVTGYQVQRCSGNGCAPSTQVGTPTTNSFGDSGLTASTSYTYRVSAVDAAGNVSGFSATASTTTPAASGIVVTVTPATVTVKTGQTQQFSVSVTGSSNQSVTWQVSSSSAGAASIGSISTSGLYTPPPAPPPGTVTVTATSQADATKSGKAIVTVTDGTAPSVPAGLTVNATSATQISLVWTASTDNVGVTGYHVQRCSGNGCAPSIQVGTPTTNSFNDSGLTPSTSYTYRVSAVDAAGNVSGFSATATTSTPASGIVVTVTPVRGGLTVTQTLSVKATVTGDSANAGVTWSFTSTGSTTGGQFSSNTSASGTPVTFTAPTGAGVVTITATSVTDGTKIASATIGVTDLAGVFTYHNDNSRDGVNAKEYALTTANVKSATFGKLFSCPVDGEMYAQPLWVANLGIAGGTHNVVFAATENDTVYAFDADASPCKQYWKKSFLGAGVSPVPPADTGTPDDINTMIGITGTPVIDPATQTLYVVAKTKEGTGNYHQRLHALSLIDGSEKFSGPVDLTQSITVSGNGDQGDPSANCSSPAGQVPFCPLREGQRAGLALVGGQVYVAWASHGDFQPYHGWIMGFSSANLQQAPVLFNDSPNGIEGGIWMSGGAPAFDSANNLFVITGNGDYDGVTEFGESILKLNSSLALQDWFTPNVQATLDAGDLDLGSGGAVVLVDLPASTVPHILIGGGKGVNQVGTMYVINRDSGSMGQKSTPDKSIQQFNLNGMIYSTAAFWQNTMYIAAVGQQLAAFALNPATSMFNPIPSSHSAHSFFFPGATPSVSSTPTNANGVVWALDTNSTTAANASGAAGPAILFAYDAGNLNNALWDSTQGSGNAAGNAVKFCIPVVANGKVYVGTKTELTVYGLLPN